MNTHVGTSQHLSKIRQLYLVLESMDSKEIKATLKNAREAIRVKDYKEALRQCKVSVCFIFY